MDRSRRKYKERGGDTSHVIIYLYFKTVYIGNVLLCIVYF
jgi:hypothetical protein